jgi:hypothetical protein
MRLHPATPERRGDRHETKTDVVGVVVFCSDPDGGPPLCGKGLGTNPITGYKGTTLYFGTLQEFEVFNHAKKKSLPAGFDGNVWLSLQKTKGASDLYLQSNTWAPVTMGVVASTGGTRTLVIA